MAACAGAPPGSVPPPALSPPLLPNARQAALERALNEFYGAPYRAGGTTPDGVDCSGLVQAVLHQAGINLPRTVAQQFSVGQPIAPLDLHFGDVVFFNRYCQNRNPSFFTGNLLPPAVAEQVCHNGIYVGQGRFVHASPKGVFVSRLDAEVWRVSFAGARRFLQD